MDEEVALAEEREEVGPPRDLALRSARRGLRNPRLVAEVRPRAALVDLPERAEVEQRVVHVDVVAPELELLQQQVERALRHAAVDLEAHRVGEPAPALQPGLDRREEVLGLVLLEIEIGVARDPERAPREDLHPREEPLEMGADHLLDRHVALAGKRHEAVEQRGNLDAREADRAQLGIAHDHGDVEGEVRHVGERMRGVDRERRQHREDPLLELTGERGAIGGFERGPRQDADAGLGERRRELLREDLLRGAHELEGANADLAELLLGGPAVGGRHLERRLALRMETGDADLEELVEVPRGDREEPHALEERLAGILGEREHTAVEVEPRELAVQVPLLGCERADFASGPFGDRHDLTSYARGLSASRGDR